MRLSPQPQELNDGLVRADRRSSLAIPAALAGDGGDRVGSGVSSNASEATVARPARYATMTATRRRQQQQQVVTRTLARVTSSSGSRLGGMSSPFRTRPTVLTQAVQPPACPRAGKTVGAVVDAASACPCCFPHAITADRPCHKRSRNTAAGAPGTDASQQPTTRSRDRCP